MNKSSTKTAVKNGKKNFSSELTEPDFCVCGGSTVKIVGVLANHLCTATGVGSYIAVARPGLGRL